MPTLPPPNPNHLYRPRAEASTLSRLHGLAWTAKTERDITPTETAGAAELIARHFEARIPEADLQVLKKYDAVKFVDYVNVRAYNAATRNYEVCLGIKMPREIPSLGHYGEELYAGGPQWGFKPDDQRAVNPAAVEKMKSEGTWEKLKADQDNSERKRVREADPYFNKVVALRLQYDAECQAIREFPDKFKESHDGKYPRWGEIEAAFPVLREFIAAERQRAAAPAPEPVAVATTNPDVSEYLPPAEEGSERQAATLM